MRRLRAADVAAVAAIMAVVLAWPLRSPPIGLHGEAREGLVVQDVVAHGHWVLPRRNGELPSKPPLFHWIAAAGAHLFGLSDPTVRLPSALAAGVMALATLALGTAFGGRAKGWLALGALGGTPSFWQAAAEARVDMVFAACITVALAGFFLWYREGGAGARAACWLGAAAAVLAKGPAGAVIVGLVVVSFLVSRRELGRVRALWSWPLAAAALAVVGGWYGLAYRAGGREFLDVQLLHENLDRFLGRRHFAVIHHQHPSLRMVAALATHLLPWNLVLLASGWQWWRGDREDAAGRFLHVWWLTVLIVFTFAAGKRNVYLLPLYPAIALLAARELAVAAAGERLFGVFPVPEAIRRRSPSRPALALLAVGLVAFDVTAAVGNQVARELREPRKSLAPFARAVGARIGDAPLYASPHLVNTARMVVAYRLARSIPRLSDPCRPPGYYLAPGGGPYAAPLAAVLVASTTVGGDRVALVACP